MIEVFSINNVLNHKNYSICIKVNIHLENIKHFKHKKILDDFINPPCLTLETSQCPDQFS